MERLKSSVFDMLKIIQNHGVSRTEKLILFLLVRNVLKSLETHLARGVDFVCEDIWANSLSDFKRLSAVKIINYRDGVYVDIIQEDKNGIRHCLQSEMSASADENLRDESHTSENESELTSYEANYSSQNCDTSTFEQQPQHLEIEGQTLYQDQDFESQHFGSPGATTDVNQSIETNRDGEFNNFESQNATQHVVAQIRERSELVTEPVANDPTISTAVGLLSLDTGSAMKLETSNVPECTHVKQIEETQMVAVQLGENEDVVYLLPQTTGTSQVAHIFEPMEDQFVNTTTSKENQQIALHILNEDTNNSNQLQVYIDESKADSVSSVKEEKVPVLFMTDTGDIDLSLSDPVKRTKRPYTRIENMDAASTCSDCGRKFHNPSNLKVHMRSHSRMAPFACAICDATFTTRANKLRHESTRHHGEKKFACDICGKRFTEQKSVRVHKQTVHLKERRHKCEECGKSFTQRGALQTHMVKHQGAPSHACDACDRLFFTKTQLKAHRKHHCTDGQNTTFSELVDYEIYEITSDIAKREIDSDLPSNLLVTDTSTTNTPSTDVSNLTSSHRNIITNTEEGTPKASKNRTASELNSRNNQEIINREHQNKDISHENQEKNVHRNLQESVESSREHLLGSVDTSSMEQTEIDRSVDTSPMEQTEIGRSVDTSSLEPTEMLHSPVKSTKVTYVEISSETDVSGKVLVIRNPRKSKRARQRKKIDSDFKYF